MNRNGTFNLNSNELKSVFKINRTEKDKQKENQFYDALRTLDNWKVTTRGKSGHAVLNAHRGKQEVQSGDKPNDFVLFDLDKPISVSQNPDFSIKLKLTDLVNVRISFGLRGNDSNLIRFIYEASGAVQRWQVETRILSKSTINEIFDCNTDPHVYELCCQNDHVTFKVDGKVSLTHTTNIPVSVLRPFFRQESMSQYSCKSTIYYIKMEYNNNTTRFLS